VTEPALLVLVAEDSEDLREAYVDWFVYKGVRVEQAATGPETIEKALLLLPSVVVMDLSLPGLDGFEVARRLRKDPRTATVPLIALTGHSDTETTQRVRAVGFDAYLLKPCLPENLLAEVRRLSAAR
jgi:two-component system, cell cycle response regulator DivK